jgi:hypothetical protein
MVAAQGRVSGPECWIQDASERPIKDASLTEHCFIHLKTISGSPQR